MSNRRALYRDLERAQATVAAQKTRWRQRTGSGTRGRRPWTQEEDRAVILHDQPDSELAMLLDRSAQAIQIRRWRLRNNAAPNAGIHAADSTRVAT